MPTGVEIANAYVALQVKMPGVGRDIESNLRGAQSNVAAAGRDAGDAYAGGVERSSSRLGSFFSNIAKAGVTAMGAVAVASGAVGVRTAAGMETAQIAFTTMLQSGEKAQAFLSDLSAFAAKTPFDLPGLQRSAQSLISIGIDASKVIPIMTTLGNVTSGMGTGAEGVQRATVAIQQMNAAGRITAEDLNQLRDAGIPVFDLLTAATGRTREEIAGMAQNGKLGRQELEQLMTALETGKGLERFNGLMEQQSASLSGLWSTLQDTFSVDMAEAIQPLVPLLKDGLAGAITGVGVALPYVRTGLETLVSGLSQFQNGLTGNVAVMDQEARPKLELFGLGIRAMWAAFQEGDVTSGGFIGMMERIGVGASGLYDLIVKGDFSGKLRAAFGWEEDSTAVTVILGIRDAVNGFFADLSSGDAQGALSSIMTSVTELSPAFEAAAQQLPSFSDGLSVASGVLGFLAGHVDTLVAVMPLLVGAFVAFKVAQAGANLVGRDSLIGLGLQVGSTLTLAASNRALAASLAGTTVQGIAANSVESVTLGTRIRTTAATFAQQTATLAAAGAARVAAAGQWLLNAAMSANPIGIIIVAITALVGALVWFFTQTELGQQIWSNVMGAIGAAATWLWETVLSPVFTAIGAVVTWVWENVISPIGTLIVNYFRFWGAIALWLWENVLSPVFGKIGEIFTWIWQNIVSPIIGYIVASIQAWATIFTWLYENVISPVFRGIMDVLGAGWNWLRDNVFSPFGAAIDTIGKTFDSVAKFIATAWDGIKKAAAEPINFILGTVWNEGLLGFWNPMVKELGLTDMVLQPAELIQFADGGVENHVAQIARGGAMRLWAEPETGGEAYIPLAPSKRGRSTAILADVASRFGLSLTAFADGGMFGEAGKFAGDVWENITKAASVAWEFLTNPGQAIQKHVIDGIITPMIAGQNVFGKAVGGLAGNALKAMSSLFPSTAPTGGAGMGWESMWRIVQAGIPGVVKTSDYRPGALNVNGQGSFHALGRAIDLIPASMATFDAVAKMFPNASELIFSPAGDKQLLNGKPFNGWSDAVRAQHYNHVHLAMANGGVVPKLYDNGGWLPHGGVAMNLSGRPEPVFNSEQWDTMRRAGNGPEVVVVRIGEREFNGYVEDLAGGVVRTAAMVEDRAWAGGRKSA